jgi:hypothetical protein
MGIQDLNGDGITTGWETNMFNQFIGFDRDASGGTTFAEFGQNLKDLKDYATRLDQLSPAERTRAQNMAFTGLFTNRNAHKGFQQHEVDANKDDLIAAAMNGYSSISKYRYAKAANAIGATSNAGQMGSSEARAALDQFNTGGNGGANLDALELQRAEIFFNKDLDGNGVAGTVKAGTYLSIYDAAQALRV